jgi:hypothetical protein
MTVTVADAMPSPVAKRVTSSIGTSIANPFASENAEKMNVNSIIARMRPIRSAMIPPTVPPSAIPRKQDAVISAT